MQKAYQSEYGQEKIIGGENLYAINKEQQGSLMNRSIGSLIFYNFLRNKFYGSAFLLSPDIILTAAHNIFSRTTELTNKSYKFYLTSSGVGEDYFQVDAVRFLPQYKDKNALNPWKYDYALMKLKTQVGYQQYMPLYLPCEQCLMATKKETLLQVYGYPGKLDNYKLKDKFGKKIVLKQYGLSKKDCIISVHPQKGTINYRLSTLPGDSGTAVCIDNQVIAVHVAGGSQGNDWNIGRLVTPDLIENVLKWVEDLKGKPIKIKKQQCKHNTKNIANFPQNNNPVTIPKPNPSIKTNQILQAINFSNMKIISFNPSIHPKLKQLSLSFNELTTIDLLHNPFLTKLYLGNNRLTSIDLSRNVQLRELSLYQNRLTEIDLSYNSQLRIVVLHANQLKDINLNKCPKVTDLRLTDNRIQATIFWPLPLQKFSLNNQRVTACTAILLHHDGEDELCTLWGSQKIDQYNRKQENNRHKCKYEFIIVQDFQ